MIKIRISSRSLSKGLLCALAAILAGGILAGICGTASAAGTPTPSPAASPSPAAGDSGSSEGLLHGITVSASVGSSDIGTDVVGRIGNIEIKADDLREAVAALDPGVQAGIAMNPAALKRFLTSLLLEREMLQEIAARKFDQKPDVQSYLKHKQDFDLSQLYLKSIAEPPDDYPSEEELHGVYDARKSLFMAPHDFQIAQIFIAIPQKADQAALDKAKAKLQAIITALNQPDADFAAIAHTQSDDAKSGANGGQMGWLSTDNMPPRIRYQVLTLPPNTISAPIRLDDGLHIIKVLASKNPQPLDYNDVKVKLAIQLRAERTQANMKAFIDKIMQDNPVTINDLELSKVSVKPGK